MFKRFRLFVLPLAVVGFLVAAAAGVSVASTSSPAAKPARLQVGVEVLRFASHGRTVSATGLVTAKLTDGSGRTTISKSRVALTASSGGGCKVLHLFLKELTLHLLGLNAHLDPVTLDITGNSRGGVLGSLFCKLARAKVASAARTSAVKALNASMSSHPQTALRFSAAIRPVASTSAAAKDCQVLDLVVGPLDLQLLGLVVDLQRVHLTITATPGGGALGDVFCKLADNSTTTTTTTTTT